ncbi:MAG TPA: PilZ domain-containing protein [Candidatus Koribacter sp.]|jgi:hypothetical protein
MTESLRALEVMGVPNAEQRRFPRRSVHAGGTISVGDATYVAWVKDISETGICFFTKHEPAPGDYLRVTLNDSRLPANLRGCFEGTVVRVQRSGPGAALVAIMFGVLGAVLLRA